MNSLATGDGDKPSSSTSVPTCQRFSLAEIEYATKNFSDDQIIGHGGFGEVYKGHISIEEAGHVLVAIKRLSSESNQGEDEFRAEIQALSKLRHCHLVSLIGYCDDNNEMILIYEYMRNGTLYHHLHKADTTLNWVQRMKIAIGAGRGLDYLHTGVGTKEGIIHRDVKSSNILLDDNMEAKISDFGLSKLSPINQSTSNVDASVKGTLGYLDPEYFYTGKLSRRTDVYAFGVVLFELLTGRCAVDERCEEEGCSLVKWAKKCVQEKKLDQMVDSSIKGTIFSKCLRGFAQIAYRCVHDILKKRPTMTQVVASLQAILELQLKCDHSAKSLGITGFRGIIRRYFPLESKQNSDKNGTSLPKNHLEIAHQRWGDLKELTYDQQKEYLYEEQEELSDEEQEELSDEEREELSHDQLKEFTHDQLEEFTHEDLKAFTYDELYYATRNFQDTCFGKGTDKEGYKGWVDKLTYSPCNHHSGMCVAVKKFQHGSLIDCQMLRECNHPNLVKLIGYCVEGESHFLVYEFMHNKNFENLLCKGVVARLPLTTKVQIAFGIARGIRFLEKMQLYFGPKRKSLLQRCDIMFNKDFIPKLSDYGVTYDRSQSDMHHTTDNFNDHISPPTGEYLQMNLSGFRVILAEVVTGRRILNKSELKVIDDELSRHGKKSLRFIAESCYKSCYDVESKSKMLKILKGYGKYIPACQVETLSIATLEDSEDETFYTVTSNEHEDDKFSSATLEECQDETFSTTSFESCLW
ncbi:hypothetical protein SSX86_019931 [Deinandra increscens subsp. villosa]|uniref:Protein kinase domain-containing protein n=1 Tax=Deinandra increscens subsp. villosa TaxID=3103831 RepID=A0AAP0GW71_9ASTR